jgi:hypothetical protein
MAACAASVSGAALAADKPAKPAAVKKLHVQVTCAPAACATEDWSKLRAEWRDGLSDAAAQAGRTLVIHDTEPGASETGTWARVRVNSFRFVSPGARYTLGVFVGKAALDATVTFGDLPGRKVKSTQRYDTSSNAWQGIFAAMSSKQVATISEAIVQHAGR